VSSRWVSITSNPTRTCRTLSSRLRTKSPKSNEDDTEEKTLALYPKVQIRAFVPRISSLTRGGRWSRNQVWPDPSSGHCQVFVAPPFRPWRRKMLFRSPIVRSSSRDRPQRTNPYTGRMFVCKYSLASIFQGRLERLDEVQPRLILPTKICIAADASRASCQICGHI
jgi:hypothetical protein